MADNFDQQIDRWIGARILDAVRKNVWAVVVGAVMAVSWAGGYWVDSLYGRIAESKSAAIEASTMAKALQGAIELLSQRVETALHDRYTGSDATQAFGRVYDNLNNLKDRVTRNENDIRTLQRNPP